MEEVSESESLISIVEKSSIVRWELEELAEEVGVVVAFFLGARKLTVFRGSARLCLRVCGLASNCCRSLKSCSPVTARSIVSFVRLWVSVAASTCATIAASTAIARSCPRKPSASPAIAALANLSMKNHNRGSLASYAACRCTCRTLWVLLSGLERFVGGCFCTGSTAVVPVYLLSIRQGFNSMIPVASKTNLILLTIYDFF